MCFTKNPFEPATNFLPCRRGLPIPVQTRWSHSSSTIVPCLRHPKMPRQCPSHSTVLAKRA
eukprot:scaffold5108_cov172-Amphora_coffeaeformis.AAC.15